MKIVKKYTQDPITCFEDTVTCIKAINNSDTENLQCIILTGKTQERDIAGGQ